MTLWLEVGNPIFSKNFNSEIANLFGLKPEDIDEKYPIEIVSFHILYFLLKNLQLSNASNSTMYK